MAAKAQEEHRWDPMVLQFALTQQLKAQGALSLQDLEAIYPAEGVEREYLKTLTFDAEKAKYWELLNVDIDEHNKIRRVGAAFVVSRRRIRTKLSSAERAKLTKNGFVVSGSRFGSFGDAFHQIYSDDLPVFVSADALLHAWHRTYDEMLVDVEQWCLVPKLRGILQGMHGQVREAAADLQATVLSDGVRDADYFLTVALRLLATEPAQAECHYGAMWDPIYGHDPKTPSNMGLEVRSALGDNKEVDKTLDAIASERLLDFELFGAPRVCDFSQFKPRGHYERSNVLKDYFRAMMWCGRMDMEVGVNERRDTKQLSCALALLYLLKRSGQFGAWVAFDEMLQGFVGDTDSMTFAQLDTIVLQYISKVGMQSMTELTEIRQLNELQEMIENAGLGGQAICSSVLVSDETNPVPTKLPTVFTFLGQKFVLDSWALSNIVFDRVIYNGKKVLHRRPGCLDVCFCVFGKNSVVPDIVEKVKKTNLPYHSNLAAVREVVDAVPEMAWRKNLYTMWLKLLRTLSEPTTGEDFPQAMRTRAWAAKDTETQAASWSQLRHDTILYAKQSYGGCCACEYPAGYVDPRPEFWSTFLDMVRRAKEILLQDPQVDVGDNTGSVRPSAMEQIRNKQNHVLQNWEEALSTLQGIAERERLQQPLMAAELEFLKKIVRIERGGSGPPRYNGWYCRLFYKSAKDSCEEDLIVADVHTNPPDDTDPGSVLHEGIGFPALMTIVVDSGDDSAVYVGPVYSHHEFETVGVKRVSDSEWRQKVATGDLPGVPDWKTFVATEVHN